MAATNQALAYIGAQADKTIPLTLLRLTTMLYLSDWRSALQLKRQITDIKWVQPFVAKVPEIAQRLDPTDFTMSPDGVAATFIGDPDISNLPAEERACMDFVLHSEQKGWIQLFRIAYSTFPMLSQPAHTVLDLVALAQRYSEHHDARMVG